MSEQAVLDFQEQPRPGEPLFALGEYRRGLALAAEDAGTTRAREGDPDLYDAALDAIRELAATGQIFSGDDVASALGGVSGPAVGTAFRAAASRGMIVFAGTSVSTRPSSHGRLQRQWRRPA